MAQVKMVFYLPLRDNDGRGLHAEIDDVEMELVTRFGGWTLIAVVKGMYMMADKTPVYDESNAYAVVTDENRIPEVESLLLVFKALHPGHSVFKCTSPVVLNGNHQIASGICEAKLLSFLCDDHAFGKFIPEAIVRFSDFVALAVIDEPSVSVLGDAFGLQVIRVISSAGHEPS